MKESKFLSIKIKDLIKGFITAMLMAIVTGIYTSIEQGTFPPDASGWKAMAITGFGAGLAYILKNLLTNSNDQFMKKEIKTKT